MSTSDLSLAIAEMRLVDTHEHLQREEAWVHDGPRDVLQDLFTNYVPADLISAGASPAAVRALVEGEGAEEVRWRGVSRAWSAIRHTGYGEAVQLLAREVYGIEEIGAESAVAASPILARLRQPGERRRLLGEVAGLDHTQTDDFRWMCDPDASDPAFFLYDLSWASFCRGEIDAASIHAETSVSVNSLESLRLAMHTLFARHGPLAIAVKAQHAYQRTLIWEERSDADAARALDAALRDPTGRDEASRLCLGDWCWARGVEHAIEHNLPFKIHTGYYAGTGTMPVERIRAGHLTPLLRRYPECRFVLMHAAYPYSAELIAVVKHYPNAWADLCWAWSVDPHTMTQFVRSFIHTAPINKLFAFGGDTRWPTSALAYARQSRRRLERALAAEVADGDLREGDAIAIARRVMRDNQYDCFDIRGRQAANTAALSASGAAP